MRGLTGGLFLLLLLGCARGIVHPLEATDETDVTSAPPALSDASLEADAREPDASSIDAQAGVDRSVANDRCEDTKTIDACFDCCDARFPTGWDAWDSALEACCPNDACSDDDYEKCELVADDACAKDPACKGLAACEEVCFEKPSSGL